MSQRGGRPVSVMMKGNPQLAKPGAGQAIPTMMEPGKLINLMEECLRRGYQIQTLRMIRRHLTEPPSTSWMNTFIARNGTEILFKIFKNENINVSRNFNRFSSGSESLGELCRCARAILNAVI